MLGASTMASHRPDSVLMTCKRAFTPTFTGTAHQRSSWLKLVVPIASPTIPGGIIGKSPKSVRHSSWSVSAWTRHAPQPAVK